MTPPTMIDRYRSRGGGSAEIVERRDPVVWGGQAGPLSATALRRYERDGYLIFPALLDSEAVESCLRAVADLESQPVEDHQSGGEQGANRPARVDVAEPDDDTVLRSLFELDRHPVFAELMAREDVAGIARQLLGSDVYVHQSRLNLKRAFEGRGFPWHSDFETWHVEDGMPAMRAVSCSVALTANGAHNGPLLLIAGSHLRFVSCPGTTPSEHHLDSLRRQEYGVPDGASLVELASHGRVEAFTGPPGSVAFFECNVMHGSADNISPEPRTNAFFVYNSVDNALSDPFGTDRPRPEHLARRTPSPLNASRVDRVQEQVVGSDLTRMAER